MKRATEIADLSLKVLSCLAIIVAGLWALFNFWLAGSTQWLSDITLRTEVLPYHNELRLLVVHVKTKNPHNSKFELDTNHQDSYVLNVRKIPLDFKAGEVIHENEGDAIASADILAGAGGVYELIPGAEMDDMRAFVLPADSTVMVTASMVRPIDRHEKNGEPDVYAIGTSTIVHIGQ